MKKWISGVTACFMAAALTFSTQAISASNAIVMDGNTGRILFEKNPDQRRLIASTTKIMTALVVCEQCNVLDRMKIPQEAVGIEGSSLYLEAGEVLTVQELLYGLMLHSGNDAAVALAIYCGGTVAGFVQLMNDKAYSLGLKNTHFENPNGLDSPGHYSSAADLACLTAYAMKNPIFLQTVSTKTVRIGSRFLRNHNKLLWQIEGADGVKTGYTKAAGRILVSSAIRQGRRLIAVTLRDPDDWSDHRQLLEQGFSQYRVLPVVHKDDILGSREVAGGNADTVSLIAANDFSFALADGEETEIRISLPQFVYAPVVEGQEAGCAYIWIGDTCAGKVPLLYGETVEIQKYEKPGFWDRISGRRTK